MMFKLTAPIWNGYTILPSGSIIADVEPPFNSCIGEDADGVQAIAYQHVRLEPFRYTWAEILAATTWYKAKFPDATWLGCP